MHLVNCLFKASSSLVVVVYFKVLPKPLDLIVILKLRTRLCKLDSRLMSPVPKPV